MSRPKVKFDDQQKNIMLSLYEIGCKDIEVASILKLSSTALRRAIVENGLSATIKETKGIADRKVEMSLYRQAMKGNITACIFWLCNRQRDKWKQANKEQLETGNNVNVVVIRDAKRPKDEDDGARENVIEIEGGKHGQ